MQAAQRFTGFIICKIVVGMRKLVDTIVRELSEGMRQQMRQAIMAGDDMATYQKEYGDCVIMVDVRAYCSQITLAVVSHYDARHKSPRLEKVIEDAMPNWYSVEREVASEYSYSLTDDEIAMRLC